MTEWEAGPRRGMRREAAFGPAAAA